MALLAVLAALLANGIYISTGVIVVILIIVVIVLILRRR